jgi:hypothetical protein
MLITLSNRGRAQSRSGRGFQGDKKVTFCSVSGWNHYNKNAGFLKKNAFFSNFLDRINPAVDKYDYHSLGEISFVSG